MSHETDTKEVDAEALNADLEREIREAGGDAAVEELMDASAQASETSPDTTDTETDVREQSEGPEGGSAVGGAASEADKSVRGDEHVPASASAPRGGATQAEAPAPFHHALKRGRIARIHGDDVFVELGGIEGRNQGIVPLTQFDRPPRVGSIMDFVVRKFDEAQGLIHLSRETAVSLSTWDELTRGSVVDARVTGTNKGGLELEVAGNIKAFMPASQVDLHSVGDLEPLIGQKIEAMVQEIDRRGKKLLLSRRRLLEHRREQAARKLWSELEEGQVLEGKVVRIMEYGVFVDLGGVDGLIHISDLSHQRISKPQEVVEEGQTVEVKVLKIQPEKQRIGLGLKQTKPDPWDAAAPNLSPGQTVNGRVVRVESFGAFVEVAEGVEGLLPISEMSWKRIDKPEQVVQEGDSLRLVVLKVESEKKRLSLSLKQAKGDPWEGAQEAYQKGAWIEGRVVRETDFGAFVELDEGVEGLAHISELSDRRIGRVSEVVNEGDVKRFRVLDVDPESRRIRLSLREESGGGDAEAATAAASRQSTAKKKFKKPANLKGGMDAGHLGQGLGDLKL